MAKKPDHVNNNYGGGCDCPDWHIAIVKMGDGKYKRDCIRNDGISDKGLLSAIVAGNEHRTSHNKADAYEKMNSRIIQIMACKRR